VVLSLPGLAKQSVFAAKEIASSPEAPRDDKQEKVRNIQRAILYLPRATLPLFSFSAIIPYFGGAMITLMTLVFNIVLIILVIVGSGYFWQWFYSKPTTQRQTYYFDAKDGWRLAVHHYGTPERHGLPVILCHGLSSNRFFFELPEAPSLAKYLTDQGRDVWVAELRGSGMSDAPGLLKSDVTYAWDFDDHLDKDIEPIINKALEETGAGAVHWVGHSMGGILISAHLAANPNAPVASAVTVGSPVDFSKMNKKAAAPLLENKWLIDWAPFFPVTFFVRFLTPIIHLLPENLLTVIHTPNIAPKVARKAVALAAQLVTSNRIWLQFGRFIETEKFARPDGTPYLDKISLCEKPILVLAGSKDNMAPPLAVTGLCEAQDRPPNAQCRIIGKESGCVEDYGHLDLLVGLRSETEVYPMILDWLERHDARG
jgi:pimeloyl-ACP methyl ester carboxylesterase